MTKKQKTNKSLLSNIKQKPKKRKKRTSPKEDNLITKILLPTVVFAMTCTIFYLNPKLTLPQTKQITKINFMTETPFKVKRQITSLVLEDYDKLELKDLSKKIQNRFNLSNVSIHINANNEVFLSLAKHEPKLVVKYGKERIFTIKDQLIDKTNYSTEGLPTLLGLSPKNKVEYREDRTIRVPIDDQEIIHQANLLITRALSYNIKYKTINYDEYRGFSGNLLKNNYSVVLGFPPFEPKYKKLNRIIYELKTQGKFSANIELDYQGKAFVKKL